MIIKSRLIRGLRSAGIPPGTFVGSRRVGSGTRPAELIPASDMIALASGGNPVPGGVTPAGAGLTAINDGEILANISGVSATPLGKTMTAVLDYVFGSTRGMILRRGAAVWQALTLGSSGKFLKSDGTDAVWDTASLPLSGATDVAISGQADKDFFVWDSATSKWKNRSTTLATSYLDAMVGDSGAGGTKGLVPAPAAGAAAAGKFLKADGTFAVPAGTSTGTVTNTGTLTNHAPIIGTGGVDIKALAAMTNGQLIIGSTGADPVLAALAAGANITITNAAGSITIAASAGGGGGIGGLFAGVMSALPTDTSTGLTTWQNQVSAVKSNDPSGLRVSSTDTSGLHLLTKAVPATPYTVTGLVSLNQNTANFSGSCFGFTDGTKIEVWLNQPGSARLIQKWTNATTFSANDLSTTEALNVTSLKWWRIADDGTTVTFSTSQDGYNFVSQFSVAKASGFLGATGYTKICFGISCNGVSSSATLMSYAEA